MKLQNNLKSYFAAFSISLRSCVGKVECVRKNCKAIAGRVGATNLPYEDESFDAVMIANALHIMPEPEKALAEIRRVLKKDGLFLPPPLYMVRVWAVCGAPV